MGFSLRLALRAHPVKIELLARQMIAGTGLDFPGHLGGVQIEHVVDPTAFHTTHMRVVGHVGIIAEAVFAGVENLHQADFVQNIDRLVDRRQAGHGKVDLYLCVDLFNRRMPCMAHDGVDDGQQIKFTNFSLYIDVLPHKIFRREGNDVFVNQNITLTQAILGDVIEVPTLDGKLKIRVKSGTQPGTLIRLRGKGIKDVNGYGYGDLYVRLNLDIPSHLSAKQKELIKELGL